MRRHEMSGQKQRAPLAGRAQNPLARLGGLGRIDAAEATPCRIFDLYRVMQDVARQHGVFIFRLDPDRDVSRRVTGSGFEHQAVASSA